MEFVCQAVMVSSMSASPVLSLYRAVNQLYNPLLLRDATWSARLDPKLRGLLSELEAALGTSIRASGGGAAGTSLDTFSGVLTPLDEVAVWESVARTSAGADRARGVEYSRLLESFKARFLKLEDGSAAIAGLIELIEDVQVLSVL